MPTSPVETLKITNPYVVLVEGKEEELFFAAILRTLNLQDQVQILPIAGKTKLPQSLKTLRNAPNFHTVTSLGIVRDADSDSQAAFQSVCDALAKADLPVPPRPLETVGAKPQVAVMILPGANQSGMLEDLCLAAVQNDPAMPCVQQYFQCLRQTIQLDSPSSKAKALVFLASKPVPNLRLGEAAQKGYWPLEHQAFDQIRNFLERITSSRKNMPPIGQD